MDTSKKIPPPLVFDKETALNDNDCCIVELKDSQQTVINHISSVYSLNKAHVENKQVSDHTKIRSVNDEPASIVIDVDLEKDNDCTVIDNKVYKENQPLPSCSISDHNTNCFDELCRENPLLIELIEKCVDMENNNGMLRVIYRTLVPLYRDSEETYKKSDKLKRILMKTIKNIDIYPERKFSHIKTLCEELKKYKGKKRVQLVTLKSSLNGKFSSNETQSHSIPNKRRKVEVINLDDDDDDVIECSSDTDVQIYDNRDLIISEKPSPLQIVNDPEAHVEIDNTDSDIQISEQSEEIDDDVVVVSDYFHKKNRTNHNSNENINIQNDPIHQKNENRTIHNTIENNNIQNNVIHDKKENITIHNSNENINIQNNAIHEKKENRTIHNTNENINIQNDVIHEKNENITIHNSNENITIQNNAIYEKKENRTIHNTNENINIQNNVIHEKKENTTIYNSNENINVQNDAIVQKISENENNNSTRQSDTFVERNSKDILNREPTEMAGLRVENYRIITENVETNEAPYNVKDHIALLECQISRCNDLIKKYEEAEVCDDSFSSPYLQAEYYKSKVVSFYKEICKLMGTESVKHHKVRLKVAPGHPEGPVRCLEQFINDNIDENGEPPFPDMHDVINCVNKANLESNLGWSKKQIENEARALFIHFGRTVQKRRQKREWRHLLSYVKEEAPDPADVDPTLSARLNENAKVAKQKEDDLLARYVAMENSRPSGRLTANEVGNQQDIQNTRNNDNKTLDLVCNGNITNNLVIFNPWNAPLQISEVPIEFCNPNEEQNLQDPVVLRTIEPTFELPIINNNNSCNASNTVNKLGLNTNGMNTQQKCDVNTCSTTNEMSNYLENVNNGAINQNVVSSTVEVKIEEDLKPSNDVIDRSDNVTNNKVNIEITNTQENYKPNSFLYSANLNNNLECGNINKSDAIQINEVTTNVEELKTTNSLINTKNSVNASSSHVCGNNNNTVILESSDVDLKPADVTDIQRDLNNLDNRFDIKNRKDESSFEELSNNGTYEIVFYSDDEGSLQTDTDVIVERESDDIEDRVNTEKSDIASNSRECDINNTRRLVFENDIRYQKADLLPKKEPNNIEDRVYAENEIASSHACSSKNNCRFTFESDIGSIKTDVINDVAVKKVPNNIEDRIHTENANDTRSAENIKNVSYEDDNKNTSRVALGTSEEGVLPTDVNDDTVIKKEPLDISSMLQLLGDNYTATVIDIEDPFLVIEISDSSESEDEE